MATASASIVLQHIRSFAAAEQTGQLPDRQLLERFTSTGEQRAFAALVRRHGPLVLGVCRRVLGNWHDAEDAFQATFLVLVRKAASISKHESLASWLYQVAYHAALKARAQAAARLKHEHRAGLQPPPDPLDELTARELLAVLDEELLRLPERYRGPLVLCFLEGQTRDQAARQLHWSLRTLRRRVDDGKKLLAKRLIRRGLTLSSGLAVAGLTETTATAAVPALLANNTVKAAFLAGAGKAVTAGVVSAPVAALADGLLKTMVASKIKIAAVLLLAFGVALGIGMATHQAFAHRQTAAVAAANEPDKPAGQSAKADKKSAPAATPAAAETKEKIAVAGRVVGEAGEPLADADIGVMGVPKDGNAGLQFLDPKPLARTKANRDGQFRLKLNRDSLDKYRKLYVLGGKAGRGVNWEPVPLEKPGVEITLRLPKEKVIRGRVFDLQGQPAVGVSVRITALTTPSTGDVRGLWVGVPKEASAFWPTAVTTDKDGKFTLQRLNPRHRGGLRLESDRFAPREVEIKSDTEKVQTVNVTLAPAQIIEGVVTAADTGKPMPHVALVLRAGDNPDVPLGNGPPITGQADEKGRFRLNPYSGKVYTITATAPEGQPYLRLETSFKWPKGAVRHETSLAMKRGVLIRGKVTDATGGQPIAQAVVHDAAHLWIDYVTSNADGVFQIVVPAGRGHLLVKGPNNDYIARETTDGELRGVKQPGFRYYPDALVPFDLKAGSDRHEVSVKLRRGVTITGQLLRPDGKPADEAVLLCWNQLQPTVHSWFGAARAVHDGHFELRGCDPELTYPVHFLDAKNQVGATIKLSAKEAGRKPLTVRLEPCGKAVARFVDKEGKPLAGFRLLVFFVVRPEAKKQGLSDQSDADFAANVDPLHYRPSLTVTDAQGRCTFPALIPGATYRIVNNNLNSAKDFSAKSGENLQLGDIVIARPQ